MFRIGNSAQKAKRHPTLPARHVQCSNRSPGRSQPHRSAHRDGRESFANQAASPMRHSLPTPPNQPEGLKAESGVTDSAESGATNGLAASYQLTDHRPPACQSSNGSLVQLAVARGRLLELIEEAFVLPYFHKQVHLPVTGCLTAKKRGSATLV